MFTFHSFGGFFSHAIKCNQMQKSNTAVSHWSTWRGLIKAPTPKVFFSTSAVEYCWGGTNHMSAKTNRVIKPSRPMVLLDEWQEKWAKEAFDPGKAGRQVLQKPKHFGFKKQHTNVEIVRFVCLFKHVTSWRKKKEKWNIHFWCNTLERRMLF